MGISIGLVGLGAFGSAFAEMYKNHPLVDRVALCDREPERIRKFADLESWQDKFNPSDAYDNLDDICKADLDALVIITQPWLHAPQCLQAMESGKHVYSAVPISAVPDGDEILDWCDKLVETCRKTGLHYMLGETSVYHANSMFCRKKAAAGEFGDFVYCEGEYFHDTDLPACNLRDVAKHRSQGKAGEEWSERSKVYAERGIKNGPMHYPTHSVSGPINIMKAHALKVCCWGYRTRTGDKAFGDPYSHETALFQMSNGSTMRICESREIGFTGREDYRIYGTQASYEFRKWCDKETHTPMDEEAMRNPLPPEVFKAFAGISGESNAYGGHGGSHAYLVHEFVDAVAHDRVPEINVWEAVRYMACGVMAHKSALKEGEVLDVPDWGDPPA